VRLQFVLGVAVWAGCSTLVPGSAPGPVRESALAQDVIVLAPGAQDFGMLQVGEVSSPSTLVVDPASGNQADTIVEISASCPDFVIDTPGLPADVFRVCEIVTCDEGGLMCEPGVDELCQTTDSRSYTFTARFQPVVAGPVSCVVTIRTADDSSTQELTLTGIGVPLAILADVQPAMIAFGDVRRNANSSPAELIVRSMGGGDLAVAGVEVSPGFAIQDGPQTGYSLAPNTSQRYEVVCHPPVVGELSGQLVVISNDPGQPRIAIPLACRGIDSNLDIEPSPAQLATTRVGEPVEASIDLRNTGDAAMTLESVTLTGDDITMVATPTPGTVLDPSEATQVSLRFGATAKGDVHGTLVATYDGGQVRRTEISGRALASSLALTPDGDVSFGPVCAGESKTQEFTLIGNDQGGFAVDALSDPGAPFTITAPALPVTVQGAGANQVKFKVTAAPTAAGMVNGEIVVHTDIPAAVDHMLHLHVEGLPAGITATPPTIELGANAVNRTTIGKSIHLTNCSEAPIAFTNPRIEGGDALDFAIVAQPALPMIPPAGDATWLIVLQAHSVGLKLSSFVVDHDGGSATVELQGEGLGDAPPELLPVARGSYYACATGRPSTLWPIALALLVLRRRRARAA